MGDSVPAIDRAQPQVFIVRATEVQLLIIRLERDRPDLGDPHSTQGHVSC